MKGFKYEGFQVWRDSSKKGIKYEGIKKGFRYEGIQVWSDSSMKGFKYEGILTEGLWFKNESFNSKSLYKQITSEGI